MNKKNIECYHRTSVYLTINTNVRATTLKTNRVQRVKQISQHPALYDGSHNIIRVRNESFHRKVSTFPPLLLRLSKQEANGNELVDRLLSAISINQRD